MNIGDLVVQDGDVWKISNIYLGGIGVQDVVGLTSLTKELPLIQDKELTELLVPLALIKDKIYTKLEMSS